MPISALIVQTIITLLFSWFLLNVGRTMMATSSMRGEMEKYLKNPQQGTWTQKFFYGWAFPWQVSIMRRLTQGAGDTLMTAWLKISGFIFIVFALFFIGGNIVLWYMYFNA